MSQASGMTGGGFAAGSRSNSKAVPVLLLGLAVALGVALLHSLDNSPTVTEASLQTTTNAAASASIAPVIETTTTLAVRTPSEVKVLITNGTTVSGVAAKLNARLQPIGYQLGTPGNTTTPSTETSVQYADGYQAEAQAVASSLGLASSIVKPLSTPAPVADTQNANVVVVIGNELAATTNAASGGAANAATAGTANATGTTVAGSGSTASTTAPSSNSAASNSSTASTATTQTTASASAAQNGPLGTYTSR